MVFWVSVDRRSDAGASRAGVARRAVADGKMAPAIVVTRASDVDPRAPAHRGDENLGQFEKIFRRSRSLASWRYWIAGSVDR
jgi:hypothetical protein